MAANKEQTFQQSMERLEEIVRLLEDGCRPLEESIALYEEGQALAKQCEKILSAARLKIDELEKEEKV